jgi:glycosyltransferase involved in cell wall biosynthesis
VPRQHSFPPCGERLGKGAKKLKMKKVLAIAPYPFLPYFSGGQKFIAKFFEWLSRETELDVISVAENDTTLAPTYKIIPLLKKSFSRYYDRSLVHTITELVQKEKFDAIIWEHPYYAWLAKRIKKRTGIKTIIHTHNIEYQRFKSLGKWWWPVLKAYEKKCLQKADAILFITPEDRDFAVKHWNIEKQKTLVVPYGIDIGSYPADKAESKLIICRQHQIPPEEKILLFNGILNYKPNLDALKIILDEINPYLLKEQFFRYKIIICGKGLPEELNSLKDYADKNIIYAGFVDNIETYFKAADVFLNPVQSGGGIKTKMVEAIAYGTTVISTETGAAGMDRMAAGDKLIIIPHDNWKKFGEAIIHHAPIISPTAGEFYKLYAWEHVIHNVIGAI